MKTTLLITLSLVIFSCNNSQKKEIPLTKTKEIVYPDFLTSFIDSIPTLAQNFKLDSLFFRDTSSFKTLKAIPLKDIKLLTENLNSEELTETNRFYINDLISIQTAILKGTYDTFVKKLDIGMTKSADANYLGKILYPDSVALILWKMNYSSYEACPFYQGAHVLASIVYDGKIVQTLQIAGHLTNSDPPMSLESYDLCKFSKDGKIKRKSIFRVNEEEVIIEKGEKTEIFTFTSKGFQKQILGKTNKK